MDRGNPIKTSLQDLRFVQQDNGELVLMANSSDNTVKSARFLKIIDDKIYFRNRTCSCTGCSSGCSPVVGETSCACVPDCPPEKPACKKTETVSY